MGGGHGLECSFTSGGHTTATGIITPVSGSITPATAGNERTMESNIEKGVHEIRTFFLFRSRGGMQKEDVSSEFLTYGELWDNP